MGQEIKDREIVKGSQIFSQICKLGGEGSLILQNILGRFIISRDLICFFILYLFCFYIWGFRPTYLFHFLHSFLLISKKLIFYFAMRIFFWVEEEKRKNAKTNFISTWKITVAQNIIFRLDNFERMSPRGYNFFLPISISPRRQRNDSYYHHNRV